MLPRERLLPGAHGASTALWSVVAVIDAIECSPQVREETSL